MSKDKPEVGDVWEDRQGWKALIVERRFSLIRAISENFIIRIIDYRGIGIPNAENIGDFTYLGKSKANIDDLFEVRDDLPDKWKVRQVNL